VHYYVSAVLIMIELSVFSFHFIEQPMRRLVYTVKPSVIRASLFDAMRGNRRSRNRARHVSFLVALSCVVWASVAWQTTPDLKLPAFLTEQSAVPSAASKATKLDPTVLVPPAALSSQIADAVFATTWPTLNPSASAQETVARAAWHTCAGVTDANLAQCTYGDPQTATHTAVLVGDSYAMAWVPMLKAALTSQHWVLYELTFGQCPASNVPVSNADTAPNLNADCNARHAWNIAETLKLNPDLVILASAANTLGRLASKHLGQSAADEYQAGLVNTIESLHPSPSRRILTISPPPDGGAIQICKTPTSNPAYCVAQVSDQWHLFATAEKAAATATKTAYADTHLWFCTSAGLCPSFVGSVPVRWDGAHLTEAYSASLAAQATGLILKTMK
jgi:hypothetical protein